MRSHYLALVCSAAISITAFSFAACGGTSANVTPSSDGGRGGDGSSLGDGAPGEGLGDGASEAADTGDGAGPEDGGAEAAAKCKDLPTRAMCAACCDVDVPKGSAAFAKDVLTCACTE